MQKPQLLSAEKFLVCLKEGVIPSGPYMVEEEVKISGNSPDDERLVVSEPVDLKEGTFSKMFDMRNVIFESGFTFGNAEFLDFASIDCIFKSHVSFSYSKFKVGLRYLGSTFENKVGMNDAYFDYLSFENATFFDDVNFNSCTVRVVSFESAVFKRNVNLSSAAFVDQISFDEARFELLSVGSNPGVGWLYEKTKQGVLYSLEDACEMCGHTRPLKSWIYEESEKCGRVERYWKAHRLS